MALPFGGVDMTRFWILFVGCCVASCGSSHTPPAGTDGGAAADGGTSAATLLAGSLPSPSGLALDATSAYLVTVAPADAGSSLAQVVAIPKVGGGSRVLAPNLPTSAQWVPARSLAVDGSGVYLFVDGTPTRVPLAGGAPVSLAAREPALWPEVALDDQFLYWTNGGFFGGGVVRRLAKSGGTATDLVSRQDTPTSIAVDATRVYWVNRLAGGVLMSAALDGSGASPLGNLGGDSNPHLALDAQSAYWSVNGYLAAVPKGGGTKTALVPRYGTVGSDIASDGQNVYWLTEGTIDLQGVYQRDGEVWRMPVGGGTATRVIGGQVHPVALALDEEFVYWVARGELAAEGRAESGALYRMAK
jgi:hypothetical protein